jgi:outer membrane immunogenic protein
MTNKFLRAFLIAGASILATGAFAADLPTSAPPPAPYIPPPPPVFTWTGFYVGVNAGVSFNGTSSPIFVPNGALAGAAGLFPSASNNTNFTGGGQIGYNYQVGQFVFGVEGDVDYLGQSNLNGTFPTTDVGGAGSFALAGANRNQVFGTVRGRIGYAVDRALFYATGGVAFGGNSAPTSITFANSAGVVCATCTYTAQNHNADNVGGVVGGGVEYAFTPNWTGKVEYLHTFFNNQTITYANGFAGQAFTTNGFKFDTNIVRVGLNYKF